MANKRNVNQNNARNTKKSNVVTSERSVPSAANHTDPSVFNNEPWTPSPGTAFKLLMSARLCAALWSVVSDCDETYNYWEPAHFLNYGRGFQTWEYSPAYAIRSYAYILLHVLPMKLCAAFLGDNTILVFYMTRCMLGVCCAISEMLFYRGVCKMFGPNVGRLTLILLLFSAGMFASASAFLPSSFSMYLTMVAYGSWFVGDVHISIMSIAASAIIGWPFAGALGIPIAFDALIIHKRYVNFFKWCGISLIVFMVPMVLIDMHFYGKLVIAPLNIVLYNVISGHGPELYGVEPLSYYIINGFLNFNLAYFMALGSLPFLLLTLWFLKPESYSKQSLLLALSPLYIWVLIFFTRPHKEERFLFPIYPFIAMGSALVLDTVQRLLDLLLHGVNRHIHYTDRTNWVTAGFSFLFAVLSFSRIVAVYQGYHAPLDIYVELHRVAADPKIHTLAPDKTVNVCVGKEWYRFPSSYFLPGPNWNLQFLQSEFKGLLPKPYEAGPDATRVIPSDMNDVNREEPSRYIDISRCHYLIDRDTEDETALEPRYSTHKDWTVVKQAPFIDASKSHRLFRAFYIPFLSSQHCHYTSYNLLKTTRSKKISRQSRKSR
ncbi:alpha-1,2-mannosyltransferase ALG9-like [Physella acuta]|uniref:alpha-1,2-mannosyltransferase ALG9-like n=1 Tax=Physella acuta TaxID=109671 RepID=UPI0027DC82AB|nr:alpha-1,2-mannosyltransferase ALG9-like [Physella acuta]